MARKEDFAAVRRDVQRRREEIAALQKRIRKAMQSRDAAAATAARTRRNS